MSLLPSFKPQQCVKHPKQYDFDHAEQRFWGLALSTGVGLMSCSLLEASPGTSEHLRRYLWDLMKTCSQELGEALGFLIPFLW